MPTIVTKPFIPAPAACGGRRDSHAAVSVAIGAAAAGDTIALRGSSSATPDGAARDALRRANPLSITDNVEYGGLIYRDPKTNAYAATAPVRGSADTFDPRSVKIPPGMRLAGDYHTHGDYSKKGPNGEAVRTGTLFNDAFGSHKFSEPDVGGISHDALGRDGYAGYLGTPNGDQLKYDPSTAQTTSLQSVSRASASGAFIGAGAGAAVSLCNAFGDGRVSAGEVAAGAATGAVAGSVERYATPLADRVAGHAVARAASALGRGADATLARTAVSRIGGTSIAGTVASIGLSAFTNRAGIVSGDSRAAGHVAGDAAVGLGSALTGAAAGAAIGSAVPMAGTIVGAGVGFIAGSAADAVMRGAGVDTCVGRTVTGAIDDIEEAFGR